MSTADRRRTLTGLATIAFGLAVLAAAGVSAWSWRDELPDPVATHWGADGVPNGFMSLGSLLAFLLGLGGGIVLLFGSITWGLGHSSVNRRIGSAGTVWISLFLSIILVGSLYVQRGITDAREVRDINGVLIVAVVGSLVPAVIAALVVPRDPPQPAGEAIAADAPRVRLVEGERAMWIGRASSKAAFAIAVPIALFLFGLAVVARTWAILIVDVLVIGALVTLSAFVIRIDRKGLTVRSAVGWPRYVVPLDEVVRADVTTVSPLRDFGGWGWRVGRGGRIGVVLRSGEALQVVRTGGRSIVVTVDEASRAAGLLNTLADRSRA